MFQKKPCSFYSRPGGCRYGNRCHYEHVDPTEEREKGPSSGNTRQPTQNIPRAPPGICHFYWSQGSCNRAFNCTFRHESSPQAPQANNRVSENSSASAGSQGSETTAPFLTPTGLSRISGSGADWLRSSPAKLDPQQTQDHLRWFLRDGYQFRTSTQMHAFVGLLLNATSANSTWSEEDGLFLLSAMSSINGCMRLTSILEYHSVSADAGFDSKVLSFQRGYMPIFQYLSSKFVVKSTLGHHVNALYALLDNNLEHVVANVESCVDVLMEARSFGDSAGSVSGMDVMGALIEVFYEYLCRFKDATAAHRVLGEFVMKVGHWVKTWADDVCSPSPMFKDILTSTTKMDTRKFITQHLRDRTQRIVSIVEREQAILSRSAARRLSGVASMAPKNDDIHLLNILENYYEGPGIERRDGPRHSNDFVAISSIQVAPTDDELICELPPFLPVNILNAPHPFPPDSMDRLFDIQFRLLREELLAPLRISVQAMLQDLAAPSSQKTQLEEIKKNKGGRYNYKDRQDSVMFNVYTNVEFSELKMDSRRGLLVGLRLDTPPGSARSKNASEREAYWFNSDGKRLMQDGLVALVSRQRERVEVHLAVISSSKKKLAEAASEGKEKLLVRVRFFDALVNFKVLEKLRSNDKTREERLLVESTVMFEAIRPFLESLKREPETVPFRRYLPHPSSASLSNVQIYPPAYSRVPGFAFNLSGLLREEGEAGRDELSFQTTNPGSIAAARKELAEKSRLDSSQAQAIIDALSRELALIQGPPGTGKTYIGVELIRTLVKSRVKPILLIAFTNHALDHMLRSVIESGITTSVIRLGGRSSDETIKEYSIEELERKFGRSTLSYGLESEFSTMEEVEEVIMMLLESMIESDVASRVLIDRYLSIHYPDYVLHLNMPPSWIRQLHSMQHSQVEDSDSPWEEAGKKGKGRVMDNSLYSFWMSGKDLDFLREHREPPKATSKMAYNENPRNRFHTLQHFDQAGSDDDDDDDDDDNGDTQSTKSGDGSASSTESKGQRESNPSTPASVKATSSPGEYGKIPLRLSSVFDIEDIADFFDSHGVSEIPEVPMTDRPLDVLLDQCSNVWSFSKIERTLVNAHWVKEYRVYSYQTQRTQRNRFEALVAFHEVLRARQHNRDEEIRLQLMRNCDLIGCTTTGAAKLTSLLKGLGPRVMIVEEAGQVLESHVLAGLVDSIDHLILIGDPLQLRPTINNYALSVDNPRGGDLYRFDMSLMERLSSSGLPMSRLDVQRRMRSDISSLIRNTLYPGLLDHELVSKYPHVRGMVRDVFFLTHGHKEQGGGDDTLSKHNTYEVAMIKDLVKYLLRQGCYSTEGSIVVLCAYLGQLAKVRDSLRFEVVLVERDQETLTRHEGDAAVQAGNSIERVQVTQRVRIRSVDNYQGEEADIVILSLVRNSGDCPEYSQQGSNDRRSLPKIGFLKSKNRTNVALSRARQGLFILGNASDFASESPMWSSVISELSAQNGIGTRIPIKCNRHPDDVRYVSQPGELSLISPDGGCQLSCNEGLSCGHNCPYKCHSDDENHRGVFCTQACSKLCSRGHPCLRECGYNCGVCVHPVRNVELPCGHVHKSVPCYRLDDLSEVFCSAEVHHDLPTCEHSVLLPCSANVREHKCRELCDGILTCCRKSCKSKCFECQLENHTAVRRSSRAMHKGHECRNPLYCEHLCRGICSQDHKCLNECEEECRQACVHSQCKLPCSEPCAPCQEPCTWNCSHHTCPVPCGSVCARLPCDLRCQKSLSCGHQCPSVCGENCSEQICLECSLEGDLTAIADFILHRPLSELNPSEGTLGELIITLQGCKHSFTVETLDGHCQLQDYYERNEGGNWRKLKSPSTGYKLLPTCPTCRRAIRSPRYGRVYKRADLDVLERNVASKMARSLGSAGIKFDSTNRKSVRDGISRDIEAFLSRKRSVPANIPRAKAKEKVLSSKLELPVAWEFLDSRKPMHGLWGETGKSWARRIKEISVAYRRACGVASTRSAHTKTWESAFTSLYRQEIESTIQDPSNAPQHPEEYAMRIAKMSLGQPRPLADKRFSVEAIWLTLEIRFFLADLAQGWLRKGVAVLEPPTHGLTHETMWAMYVTFILNTCERDAGIALKIAMASGSQKQALHSKVLVLNSKFESFKFNLRLARDAGFSGDDRETFHDQIKEIMEEIKTQISREILLRRIATRSGNSSFTNEEFDEFFKRPSSAILEEWKDLGSTLHDNAVYSPLTCDEKKQTVSAFMSGWDFSHSGHFYACSNGHAFIIGECGGTMETARCPECSETIGGTSHNLVSTNRRDTELKDVARNQGVYPSP
ncbi:hypothetical protein M0805_007013 [Coniferiporia weirii]|nr:hypothetical protein M0805_007013 [Coniferiporia weirii]